MAKMLLGRPVADSIYEKISSVVASSSVPVTMATVGFSSPQWMQYAAAVQKSAQTCGIHVENVVCDGITPQAVRQKLAQLGADPSICGILVQQPLPKEYADVAEAVPVGKDIDCVSTQSVACLYRGAKAFRPATPLAVLLLLDFYNVDLAGKNVVIVGRGNAVGKPLALMMLQRNATVTVCHTKTVNLPAICRNADVIVSACGVAGLITVQHVTEKSIVVDVGLSFVDGKTCGDVAQEVYDVAQACSPVPGGVGPVTRAALFDNLLQAANLKE